MRSSGGWSDGAGNDSDDESLMEGYLNKKPNNKYTGSVKRRYFFLIDGTVIYSLDDSKGDVRGTPRISLACCPRPPC